MLLLSSLSRSLSLFCFSTRYGQRARRRFLVLAKRATALLRSKARGMKGEKDKKILPQGKAARLPSMLSALSFFRSLLWPFLFLDHALPLCRWLGRRLLEPFEVSERKKRLCPTAKSERPAISFSFAPRPAFLGRRRHLLPSPPPLCQLAMRSIASDFTPFRDSDGRSRSCTRLEKESEARERRFFALKEGADWQRRWRMTTTTTSERGGSNSALSSSSSLLSFSLHCPLTPRSLLQTPPTAARNLPRS